MSVCLSGLPGLPSFDAVGEPATLAQRWLTWKEEFELYVTASGISDSTQKRALLLHLVGPKVRDIFNNSIPEEIRGDAKDYKKAMDALSEHFKMRKNVPMARQAFIAAKPLVGETINNFITRLQTLAEHCDYEDERDNQVRDHAISYIKDKNLKSKLYREETLTLGKLMGDVLSGEGLKISDRRVEAIVKSPPPRNQSEVRSFLGSTQFCAKFIPNFASISSPLWDLTKKGAKWNWGNHEEKTFCQIKDRLIQAPIMAYFRQGAKTRVTTDASPVGVGAVLEQKQKDGSYRLIYYASRKLSEVERRYSQFEREALAVRWACEKFYLYLYGVKFELRIGHKPLAIVLGKTSNPPSARIERWLLYLQQFQYEITYIRGTDNVADVLSRLPVVSAEGDCKDTEEFAYSVASEAMPVALVPSEVEPLSAKDPTLELVRQAVISGDWSKLQGTTYKMVKDELWVIGQLVMRGGRKVMPESLWNRTVLLAHEGHQGVTRTKSRLREKVWWPGMD